MCIRNRDVQEQASAAVSSFVCVPKIGYILYRFARLNLPRYIFEDRLALVSIIHGHHHFAHITTYSLWSLAPTEEIQNLSRICFR